MKIRLNRAHFPVTTLGPGRRIGLWVQGCHLKCAGCIARDTWAEDDHRAIEVRDVLDWCRSVAPDGCDGVTISGGEPFEQPAALHELLAALHQWREELPGCDFDILCYSGFGLEELDRDHAALLSQLDALIPEPYVHGETVALWRGSANQPLLLLSPLAQKRYARFEGAAPNGKGTLQISVLNGRVVSIGIPDRGDMHRMERAARRRGIRMRNVSWRA